MARKPLDVAALKHDATRLNIPTAEFESVMRDEDKSPVRVTYERRNRDLDPQLVWRGKDMADWSDLIVQAPPLYIQEKVHPKALIDDLKRDSARRRAEATPETPDLFGDFNGLPDLAARTEFYAHAAHWSNRMISGDSLSVMASLAEREGLRGQVQCIYLDPPYGIRFNSNFQWSTTSRDVKDGDRGHVTREPEQVRAFRDTWRDGVHSYLTYLRDRLTVARDLLAESGSIFVQIGDENVHRVRALMDEVFGEDNFCSLIAYKKTTGAGSPSGSTDVIASVFDYVVWYARNALRVKYRRSYAPKSAGGEGGGQYRKIQLSDFSRRPATKEELQSVPAGAKVFRADQLTAQSSGGPQFFDLSIEGDKFPVKNNGWKTSRIGMDRLSKADRLLAVGRTPSYVRFIDDFAAIPKNNMWEDTVTSGFGPDKIYVVQTLPRVVERCILMTTDPGDLVLDPTCGSGTTAYVAEQWGRRWITIDTSRVAIALARSRLMGARYPWWLLADSPEGRRKEWELSTGRPAPSSRGGEADAAIQSDGAPSSLRAKGEAIQSDGAAGLLRRDAPRNDGRGDAPRNDVGGVTHGDLRHGFVYDRVPHVTLKSIANNAEIDVIWERLQPAVEAARAALNAAVRGWPEPFRVAAGGRAGALIDFTAPGEVTLPSGEAAPADGFMEWEIPRDWPAPTSDGARQMSDAKQTEIRQLLDAFWEARIARQREIDASIAAKAEFEFLYDKPHPDKSRVRVAGPFTVESLSPHRTLAVDWNDELIDPEAAPSAGGDFAQMILENLRAAGVQQAHKEDRIAFTALTGWPGNHICAEGLFMEGEQPRRAGVFIGPEFGTVSRPDLVAAAREAGDAGFDLLIACAFSYDAHSAEFDKLGRVPVLKARMNPDLHMGAALKATGAGNLFVIFGEPDIRIEDAGEGMLCVKVFGVDVFKPQTGEVLSEGVDGIALWMLDDDYNEESFFVRHAYFLGANDPYKALKTTLKAEIDEEAWATLYSDTSRPFPRPASGRIAVKVINHLGDEVMKVFGV